MIFIGHFCGVKDWDQPFSKWISEFRKRADFDTSYHLEELLQLDTNTAVKTAGEINAIY